MSNPDASAPPVHKPEQLSPGPVVREDNFLNPVPPFNNGEGFPYAPTDWPNPGDTWGWRVGKRISNSGYYSDRFLIPPISLQKPPCPRQFSSRCSLEQYILKQFPNADIDAFFSSFVWRVPSTLCRSKIAKATSHSQKKVEEKGKKEIPLAVKRKRKHTAAATSTKRRTRQSLRRSVPVCKDTDGNQSPVKGMPENVDSYIDSLDDILQKPLSEASLAEAGTITSLTQEDELAEAQIVEDNKAKVLSLKKDYDEKKEKVALLQTELDSNLLAIKEIDDQIAKLNSQRVELMKTGATKKMTMANLTNDQVQVAHAIQKIVHQVQVANSEKAEWEVKKKTAEKREAEILARFGPLK